MISQPIKIAEVLIYDIQYKVTKELGEGHKKVFFYHFNKYLVEPVQVGRLREHC